MAGDYNNVGNMGEWNEETTTHCQRQQQWFQYNTISIDETVVVAVLNKLKGKVIGDTTFTTDCGGGGGVPNVSNAVVDSYDNFMQKIVSLK